MKNLPFLFLLLFSISGIAQNLPENLGRGVNSEYLELNPVISPDGKILYFGRKNHPNNTFGTKGSETIAGSQDIWYSVKKENGDWGFAVRMNSVLNRDQYNTILSISPDGQTILLKGAYKNGKYESRGFSISTKTKTGWTIPEAVEIPNYQKMSQGLNEYAFLSNDGKKMILAFSEKKNSNSDDLYISFLGKNGKWTKPKSLGSKINTAYSETTPFLAADGRTLYFSSDRPGGLGGQDIWVSKRLGRDDWANWSAPKNLGEPINTNKYDAYFSLSAEGDYAYFLSEINSFGKKDIYRIKFDQGEKGERDEDNKTSKIGGAEDLANNALLNNLIKSGLLDSLLRNGLWKDLTGHNYLDDAKNRARMDSLLKNQLIDKMVGKNLWKDLKEFGLDQYAENSANFKEALKRGTLKNLLNNEFLKGFDLYGKQKSGLIEQKIADSEGQVGSSEKADPVVLLTGKINLTNGKDLPEETKVTYENLTTGEVLGFAKPDPNSGIYKIVLPFGEKYGITASAKGYVSSSLNLDLTNLGGRYLELDDRNISLSPIQKGSIARINNLFFEVNKAALNKESTPELNRLVDLMTENKELKIEISGHTDNTGTKEFNQKLSKERAEAVGKYLTEHGILANRIISQGYSSDKPVATNDTEDGRALNRRVEILIL